jgi:hypothetical protein
MTVRDREPTMEELMRAWLDRHEIEVRGPMPGRIESYNPTNQTADQHQAHQPHDHQLKLLYLQ